MGLLIICERIIIYVASRTVALERCSRYTATLIHHTVIHFLLNEGMIIQVRNEEIKIKPETLELGLRVTYYK